METKAKDYWESINILKNNTEEQLSKEELFKQISFCEKEIIEYSNKSNINEVIGEIKDYIDNCKELIAEYLLCDFRDIEDLDFTSDDISDKFLEWLELQTKDNDIQVKALDLLEEYLVTNGDMIYGIDSGYAMQYDNF